MARDLRVLVVGLGGMGQSHARAYAALDGFELAGLCARGVATLDLPEAWADVPRFADYATALATVKPDVVSINTWTDTHAAYAVQALEAGCHVFVEKPLAETVADAERVVETATRLGRKLVVGYILRHHPSWIRLIELARTLGKPLVLRMNLNQQSMGAAWVGHKNLMKSVSPLVDCGVHYVDVMCQMTCARPIRVTGIGARLSDEVAPDMYNYGQLQVVFDDGSVGWYEAGWGPMMSEVAYFVKDVIGPKGAVSIVMSEGGASADLDSHTKTNSIRLHHAGLTPEGRLAEPDEILTTSDEPGHDELCAREQAFLLRAIRENLDLTEHMTSAVDSLRIVLAADEAIRTGEVVRL